MSHGIKTPDGLGLHKVLPGNPDPALAPEQFWPVNDAVPEGYYRTGWELVDGTVEPTLEAIPPVPVPSAVTRRQLLLWLHPIGISRGQIKQQIGNDEAKLIEYEEATHFERAHPLVEQLGQAMGLTAAQIDEGFRIASTL